MASNQTETMNKGRRSNKPLMEKRRRERINKSLSSIKDLVLLAEQEDVSKHNKLEKADILEMTVKFLRRLHENPDMIRKPSDDYKAGFDRCTWAVENFLQLHPNPTGETLMNLVGHLRSLAQSLRDELVPRCVSGCAAGGGKMRVRAALDRSLLQARVITLKRSPSPTISPPHLEELPKPQNVAQVVKQEPQSPSWEHSPGSDQFPPSPPDSSRCSSSPDSLRGSPRHVFDQGPFAHMVGEREPPLCYRFPQPEPTETTRPLNLSVPRNTNEAMPISSLSTKGSSLSPGMYENGPLLVEDGCRPSTLSSFRPPWSDTNCGVPGEVKPDREVPTGSLRVAPYPKKDVVRRYCRQYPSPVVTQGSPWRPWMVAQSDGAPGPSREMEEDKATN